MNRSMPGLPVHHQLPEFTQTHVHQVSDTIQPSHPLSSPFPCASNPSQHQSLFQWVNSSHEVIYWELTSLGRDENNICWVPLPYQAILWDWGVISFTLVYNNPARLDQALLHRRWGGDSERLSLEQGLSVGDCRTRTQAPWWRFYFITQLPLLFKGKSWESSLPEICHPPHVFLETHLLSLGHCDQQ